ncbi:DUF1028 domain-containing protein [Geodermatophilus ruber]|uniref:Uncharacterized conserved protein, Ntn-hydrolase superfamily n=1 Tax=Geodermatophilus ruber TaxID=504800 RepID=A0A1I4G7C7_9ACTN|nr:DUF1028 domain-containing protein [Geodermatophilus ruber]SFL25021.1 Uncharacterized conserved protein, Ntn-hydrolase superfamily [Geodermatophilus ruber]
MTYSIVARDLQTGEMGVATQSQAFAVGNSVPFALPGQGVIASQSMAEPMYGQIGLDLLRGGFTANEALIALRSVDPHPERRQVAVLDVSGDLAAYTGSNCVQAAGHLVGEGCVALGNMVTGPEVWESMVAMFETSDGPLAHRLLSALRAAEEAGGDLRGRRSAAVIVVRAVTTGRPWHDTVVDLRVDDSLDPVTELGELVVRLSRYQDVVRGFQQAIGGDPVTADLVLEELRVPDPHTEPDHVLWRAIVAGLAGREDAARELMTELAAVAPQFVEVGRRFGAAGLVPEDLLERILPAPDRGRPRGATGIAGEEAASA